MAVKMALTNIIEKRYPQFFQPVLYALRKICENDIFGSMRYWVLANEKGRTMAMSMMNTIPVKHLMRADAEAWPSKSPWANVLQAYENPMLQSVQIPIRTAVKRMTDRFRI